MHPQLFLKTTQKWYCRCKLECLSLDVEMGKSMQTLVSRKWERGRRQKWQQTLLEMRLKHSRSILGQIAQGIPTVPIATGSVKPMSKSATAKLISKNEVRFSLFRWDQKMYTVKALAVRMRSDSNAAILHITIAAVLAISQNHCTRYNSIFRLFFLAFEFSCLFSHLSQALMRPNEQTQPSPEKQVSVILIATASKQFTIQTGIIRKRITATCSKSTISSNLLSWYSPA